MPPGHAVPQGAESRREATDTCKLPGLPSENLFRFPPEGGCLSGHPFLTTVCSPLQIHSCGFQ